MNDKTDYDTIVDLLTKTIQFIFQNKIKIVVSTFIFSSALLLFSYTQVDKYYSQSTLTSQNQSNTASGVASMSGISSIIGINMNQGPTLASDFEIALELLKSRYFTLNFIDKYELKPYLIAIDSYDKETGKLSFNEDLYDEVTKSFNSNISQDTFYKIFNKSLSISKKDSFYQIGFISKSAELSKRVIEDLIYETNEYIRTKNLNENLKTYEYLIEKSFENIDLNTKTIINSLIEEEVKDMALINSSSEYVLRVVDPPYIPEHKASPNRVYFLLFGAIIGFIFGVFISFILRIKTSR